MSVQPIHDRLGYVHPKLARGQVWCRTCGFTLKVDSAECMALGWPKHCGYTMTIDSPEERAAQSEGEQG